MARKLREATEQQVMDLEWADHMASDVVFWLVRGGASRKLVNDVRRMRKRIQGAVRHARSVVGARVRTEGVGSEEAEGVDGGGDGATPAGRS